MGIEKDAFDHSTFSKNRDRRIKHEVARRFPEGVVDEARRAGLISKEHFTVDGTLIEASPFDEERAPGGREAGGPPDDRGHSKVNVRGERSNETDASTTDLEALLARKGSGKEAKLCFSGHVMMENRNGLCVDISVAQATGTGWFVTPGEEPKFRQENPLPVLPVGELKRPREPIHRPSRRVTINADRAIDAPRARVRARRGARRSGALSPPLPSR